MDKHQKHLSRKQLESLLQHPNDAIEANFDAFDQESMEGWRSSKLSIGAMTKLDKKFKKTISYTSWGLLATSICLASLVIFLIYDKTTAINATKTNKYIVKLEQTDVQMPAAIDTLKTIPKKEQIQVKDVIRNQKELKNLIDQAKSPDLMNDIPFPLLTLEPLPVEIEQKPTKISNQQLAKEIYLKSFKAIDYTAYRDKTVIPIEQIILTGLPANFEDNQDVVSEEPTYKHIEIPYVDYLEKSLGYVNKGKWKLALSRFEEILKTYPDDVNARFYAGWCYFNLGQYNDACIYFSACLQLPYSNFNEEAQWYLAQSRLKNNENQIAKELLLKIKAEQGFYAQQADRLLKNL